MTKRSSEENDDIRYQLSDCYIESNIFSNVFLAGISAWQRFYLSLLLENSVPPGKEDALWKFMVNIFWFVFMKGFLILTLLLLLLLLTIIWQIELAWSIFAIFSLKSTTPHANLVQMPQTMAPLTNVCSMFWLYPKIWNEIPSSWDEAAISRLTWRLLNWDIRKSREYSYCERERAWMEIVWIYLCQKQK